MTGIGIGVGTGKSFSPKAIAGLLAYYDANLGVSGLAWNDSSGTGDTNKNLSATGTPTYNAIDASINGHASWTYTGGTTQKHQSGVWASQFAQPCTLWYVGKVPLAAVASVDNLGSSFELTGSGTTLDVYAGAILNTHLAPSSPAIIVVELNGAGVCNVYVNSLSVSATGNAGTNGGTGITIGNASSGAFAIAGIVANVGLYSGINATKRAEITRYLSTRYGIALS